MIPPPLETVQSAYEEYEARSERFGQTPAPRCPACGHHLRAVHLHGHTAAAIAPQITNVR